VQNTLNAQPVHLLLKTVQDKHDVALQHGHTWFSFDLASDGRIHVEEAAKLQESFEAAVECAGFVWQGPSGDGPPFTYTFPLAPPKGPTWPGPVRQLMVSMKAKCKREAQNGRWWCRFDLVDDGLLHEIEAAKLKEAFERAARSEGVKVQAWSGLFADKPCYELRWGSGKRKIAGAEDSKNLKALRGGA